MANQLEKQKTQIHFINEDREKFVEVIPGHTILDLALINEIDPPYSCMEGICNLCSAEMIDGDKSKTILTCQLNPSEFGQTIQVRYK